MFIISKYPREQSERWELPCFGIGVVEGNNRYCFCEDRLGQERAHGFLGEGTQNEAGALIRIDE
jgi:hypothetical protein